MTRFSRDSRFFLRCLGVILALVCAFCLFLPHFHECEGMHCTACALFSGLEYLWLPTAMGSVLLVCPMVLGTSPVEVIRCLDLSLVQLKVKLSD